MGFGGLGMWEIVLIFLMVLLLFGAKRLPEIGASLGKGIREFKGSLSEIEREIKAPADRDTISSGSAEAGEQTTVAAEDAAEDGGEATEESDGEREPRRLRTEG